jgi:hypothetical protein
MSSRNGDRSRFNRQGKQNIAKRKRTHEVMEHTAKALKAGEVSPPVQKCSVSA